MKNSLYYLGGSRGFNLGLEDSDIDLLVYRNIEKPALTNIDGFNLINFPADRYQELLKDKTLWWHYYQCLFNTPMGNGDLFKYLKIYSEKIFLNNRIGYYNTILSNSANLRKNIKSWFKVKSKEIMYLFFYLNVLTEYPKGNENLYSITHPTGDKQAFYLAIRNREMSADDLSLLLKEQLSNIDTTFWTGYPVDEKLNEEFLSILNNATNFATYEELNLPFTAEDIKSGQFQLDNSFLF